MPFLDTVLRQPSYGWKDECGNLSKPSVLAIFKEFFSRLNIFKNKKNWLSFTSWMMIVCFVPFLMLFIFKYFSFKLLIVAFVYSMVVMGSHGTVWYHRYCTHRAFKFRNNIWRFITQNITLKIIPEEIYVISHHVHHAKSDQPGDPYNAQGGFLYCFLADVNHQPIAHNLNEKDYGRCVKLMKHTGQISNTYAQYQKWGTLANPLRTIGGILLNWGFWYLAFYLIGGHALACTLFGAAGFWAVGVRTFNYEGHGKGEDKRREGSDYNREDMSINQAWPGIVAGEWHNNHHLYPKSARSGFLPHQVDTAWYYIKFLNLIGGVTEYHDSKKQFLEKYHEPHKQAKSLAKEKTTVLTKETLIVTEQH
ncbi:acyl-CoA desaturase [Mucilaginibacter robiniae]|uniref:Acyl-CoA desaturase n=1 Tax=Mucilaginibacter robiniae TaxID=2728022 RepID=A0A7L5E1I3_9SPHI|nr:fatty acid desaturase [Mucilaginibacter robiniae]QJD97035.1 acyl-CoA desaturase [Mucilaginibacter robiniae]